jgi:hypothetical protein
MNGVRDDEKDLPVAHIVKRSIGHYKDCVYWDFDSLDEEEQEGITDDEGALVRYVPEELLFTVIAEKEKLHTDNLRLQNELAIMTDSSSGYAEGVDCLTREREKLEFALKFYADEQNYNSTCQTQSCGCCSTMVEPGIEQDRGAKARIALDK